jgi:hypothetical protein
MSTRPGHPEPAAALRCAARERADSLDSDQQSLMNATNIIDDQTTITVA